MNPKVLKVFIGSLKPLSFSSDDAAFLRYEKLVRAAQVSSLFSLDKSLVAYAHAAVRKNTEDYLQEQMLKYLWKITDDTQFQERVEQIRQANEGWQQIDLKQLYTYVLSGVTFDAEGKVEPESVPMFRKRNLMED